MNSSTDYIVPVKAHAFNSRCVLPYGLNTKAISQAMIDFIEFLAFINQQLHSKQMPRLESFLMPASFSSLVGEFVGMRIPEHCLALVKNHYHNGHPDLIPTGLFPGNAIAYTTEGIEVKASRYPRGWQGHNPEAVWLMVFHFDSHTAQQQQRGIAPKPFGFKGVYAAQLTKDDWTFSGRSEQSRRTVTASVNESGVTKMRANWVYRDLEQG